MNWYFKVLKNYATFTGRASRTEYWMFTLFQFIISMALLFTGGFFTFTSTLDGGDISFAGIIATYSLLVIYGIVTLVPTIAVTVRRLHDMGKSGVWYLIAFVPCIGGLWLFILTLMESEHGSNQWGPNPHGEGNEGNINEIGRE